MKPDVSAPGQDILGAGYYIYGNDSVALMSGTSMATPHFTGSLVLLLSKMRASTLEAAGQISLSITYGVRNQELFGYLLNKFCKNSVTELGEPIEGGGRKYPLPGFPYRKDCEDSTPHVFPNMFYGCGRVSVSTVFKSE